VRFRLQMAMVVVAACAGVMAEMGQRSERLVRLSIAHHEKADARFDRTGRICKLGQTPASIEASYRRQGPMVWREYQAGTYHLAFANMYGQAANRPWLSLLITIPPIGGLNEIPALAEWAREALLEATPLSGLAVLLLILVARTLRAPRSSSERHVRAMRGA
jgi:hypothetical protein